MQSLTFALTLNTPAFLGNADQSGQWRTPPIKALLRQWWRVAYAAECRFRVDVAQMRHDEGVLFGHAWLENDTHHGERIAARKSAVRLRLDRWDEGKLKQWPTGEPTVAHPEVKNREGRLQPVGSQLYLGYGPLTFRHGATQLKAKAALQAQESAVLSLAVPEAELPRLEHALWLMDQFGTLGGRSRNGWGSFSLQPPELKWIANHTLPLSDWRTALQLDWPHALGRDERGALIWQTTPFNDWKGVMTELAKIKIGLRTQFRFPNEAPPHSSIEQRHWLSYPITNHATREWDRNARLPNSLRFKVRAEGNQLRGLIFHLPCKPPAEFHPHPRTLVEVWQQVHHFLDTHQTVSRREF